MRICKSKTKVKEHLDRGYRNPMTTYPNMQNSRVAELAGSTYTIHTYQRALHYWAMNQHNDEESRLKHIKVGIARSAKIDLSFILDGGFVDDAGRERFLCTKRHCYDEYYWAINEGEIHSHYLAIFHLLHRFGYICTLYTTTPEKYKSTIYEILDTLQIRPLFAHIIWKPKLKLDGIGWLAHQVRKDKAPRGEDIFTERMTGPRMFVCPPHWKHDPRYRGFFGITRSTGDVY